MAGSNDHIKPLRLFDISQAQARVKPVELTEVEREHLRICEECQNVIEVFARQFNQRKTPNDKSGDAA